VVRVMQLSISAHIVRPAGLGCCRFASRPSRFLARLRLNSPRQVNSLRSLELRTERLAMRKALLFLSLVLPVGCLGSDPVATLDGTYTLRSDNGAALPYTVSQTAGTKVVLLNDAYTIFQGMTFHNWAIFARPRTGSQQWTTRRPPGVSGWKATRSNFVALRRDARVANPWGNTFTVMRSVLGTSG